MPPRGHVISGLAPTSWSSSEAPHELMSIDVGSKFRARNFKAYPSWIDLWPVWQSRSRCMCVRGGGIPLRYEMKQSRDANGMLGPQAHCQITDN